MADSAELTFEDGTPVRFLLGPGPATAEPPGPGEEPGKGTGTTGGGSAAGIYAEPDDDLPAGMGPAVPVARGHRGPGSRPTVASFTAGALRGALRPLGALLEEVHHAVSEAPVPPTDISVSFGVQIGEDLKLGIVGGTALAHLTVTANWQPLGPGAGNGALPGPSANGAVTGME
ncbi:CU044_2847 family protein [Streptomyces sp. NPDC058953]|uniref:CU044_2847 family protein n=1 Tax=unclassified Streptomyces TaxID=2593676 RepID=UPI0036C2756F